MHHYTTLTNFITKYHVMFKVYTDIGDVKELFHVFSPVHMIVHSLRLVDYLHAQADNPCYNYYLITLFIWMERNAVVRRLRVTVKIKF